MVCYPEGVSFSEDEGFIELILGGVAVLIYELIVTGSHVEPAHEHVLGGGGAYCKPVDEPARLDIHPLGRSVVLQPFKVVLFAKVGVEPVIQFGSSSLAIDDIYRV